MSSSTLVSRSPNNKSNVFIQHAGAFTANISAFALGNVLAWSSPASPLLLKGDAGFYVNEDQNSLVGSMVAFGAALSCLPAGYLSDRFGRKRTLLGLVCVLLLGWGLIIWPSSVKMLYAGRFILGLCAGVICTTTPVFTGEISQKEIRGALGVYYQLLLTLGILFTYVIGSQLDIFWISLVCGLVRLSLTLFPVCLIVPIVFGATFIFFPETPVYFLTIGEPEKARESLRFFRGPDYDLEPELIELAQYSNKSELSEQSLLDSIASKQGMRSLFISIGLMVFQQLSGINAVIFYTTSIFEDSGSSLEPRYATIVTGMVQFLSTILIVFIIDRLGRVILLGTSCVLMAVLTFFLGLYLYFKEKDYDVSGFSWAPVVLLCVFLIAFSFGYGPVPWALMPEIIPSRSKGWIMSIACVTNWVCAFLVTKFFSNVSNTFGIGGTFWVFAALSVVGAAFSFGVLPETKGKSLEEIQRKMGGEA